MENRIAQQPRRQARPGYWQYPDLSPAMLNEQAGPLTASARRQLADRRATREHRLGSALGWLSIGIGLANLLAPRAVARTTGLPDWPMLIRVMGARELVSGIGLLRRPDNQVWRWSRVAGDALDLGLLGVGAAAPGSNPRRLATTALVVAAVGALDVRAGNPPHLRPSLQTIKGGHGAQRVQEAISVNKPPEECYRFWRDLERLPTFMRHLESVQVQTERLSHWCATGPVGSSFEWDAEITEDRPGELLAWRSVKGAEIDNAGTVRFAPDQNGKATVVQVQMRYQPPAGAAGAMVARLLGEEPSIQIREDLRRFKQLIETGEIATTEGQSHGKRTLKASLFNKGVTS